MLLQRFSEHPLARKHFLSAQIVAEISVKYPKNELNGIGPEDLEILMNGPNINLDADVVP